MRDSVTLLRIQLDDEMLLDGHIDIFSNRNSGDLGGHAVCVILNPLGNCTEAVVLNIVLYLLHRLTLVTQGNDHARLHR